MLQWSSLIRYNLEYYIVSMDNWLCKKGGKPILGTPGGGEHLQHLLFGLATEIIEDEVRKYLL